MGGPVEAMKGAECFVVWVHLINVELVREGRVGGTYVEWSQFDLVAGEVVEVEVGRERHFG